MLAAVWPALCEEAPVAAAEHAVKAAFVYNFTQFVHWPGAPQPGKTKPIKILVLGESPIGPNLEAVLLSNGYRKGDFEIQTFPRGAEVPACHILIVASAMKQQARSILEKYAGLPVLTIGEPDGFAEEGGMIGLLVENKRIRFEINVAEAERAGLKISSRLLAIARHVYTK
jgi:hypothetical protein